MYEFCVDVTSVTQLYSLRIASACGGGMYCIQFFITPCHCSCHHTDVPWSRLKAEALHTQAAGQMDTEQKGWGSLNSYF